eukprot:maker-scaffold532_size145644-snap-gene-0.29 protein:Tk04525 transcript:maker-scaffold532_size145644-snap-gene-0.29-mRNA-1 annotation:"low-density lipoprotein receptor-related protein 6 isoform x1"
MSWGWPRVPRGRRRPPRKPDMGVFCFILALLGLAIQPVQPTPYIIYANKTDIRLVKIKGERDNPRPNIVVKHLENVSALDYVLRDDLVCWSEVPNHWIHCADIDKEKKGNDLIVQTGLIAPEGLACDWVNNNIYWADTKTKRIEVAALRRTSDNGERLRKVLIWDDIDLPRALAVAPQEGILFWSDWGHFPKIERVSLDGDQRSRRVLVEDNIMWPNGLTLDFDKRLLFWVDARFNQISVISWDGGDRRDIIADSRALPHPFAVTFFNDILYWTDWNITSLQVLDVSTLSPEIRPSSYRLQGRIRLPMDIKVFQPERQPEISSGCNINYGGCSHLCLGSSTDPRRYTCACPSGIQIQPDGSCRNIPSEILLLSIKEDGRIRLPMDIKVFQPERQPEISSGCNINYGGCSHLCLGSSTDPRRYTCACPSGIQIQPDGSCRNIPSEILLLSIKEDVRRISLDTPDFTDIVIQVDDPAVQHHDVIAIDFDPVEQFVYFTYTYITNDSAVGIYKSALDGSNFTAVITSGIRHPDGVAVDWVARNVYWTDNAKEHIAYIGVAKLDGSSQRTLIWHGLDEPRAIVLDPTRGWLFWSDWGEDPGIHRAYMDGTHREAIVKKEISWPNGITLDIPEEKIYWCDAKEDRIDVANYDGTGRRTIVKNMLPHPFGLTLLGDSLYWTDWQDNAVERANKYTGENRTILVAHLDHLMSLKASKTSPEPWGNECSNNNGACSQLCLFTPGGRQCQCSNDYDLDENLQGCVLPEAFLLYTRKKVIGRLSMNPSNPSDFVLPIDLVRDASALDFDVSNDMIYWTDVEDKSISRAHLNGSDSEVILKFGLDFPDGMAVDWMAKNIFWTDMGLGRIEMARLNGTSRRVLLWKDLKKPASIVLNPVEGKMYWSSWGGETPLIEEANLDGSGRRVFQSNVGRANGLTMDYQTQRLYWADQDNRSISYAFVKAPQEVKAVISDLGQPYALTLYKNYLYWVDWKTGLVETADKDTGENRLLIQKDIRDVMDILVYQESKQQGKNPCSTFNGGCDYLCFPVDGSAKCGCPTHYLLDENGRSCRPPQDFLLFGQKNKISRWVDELVIEDTLESVMPISGARNIYSLSYDPVMRLIYWIDFGSKRRGKISIKRAFENGTLFDRRLQGHKDSNFKPYDLAIDPIARVFYWTCEETNSINITRMDSNLESTLAVLPLTTLDVPRSITLHYLKGFLFWVNMGQNHPRIERSRTNSVQKVTLFANLTAPRDLTVDMSEDILFWADSELKVIESAHIDGSNRRIVVTRRVTNPVGMGVLHNHVYWADAQENAILRANKHTGNNIEHIISGVKHLSSLFSSQQVLDISNHACLGAGCSHLCSLDHLGLALCHCPLSSGLVLNADGRTCGRPPTCKPSDFTCATGACIPLQWRCDGPVECADHSDEINCPECGPEMFRCRNGECVDSNFVCNGKNDCKDSSDELKCCSDHEFRCLQDVKCIDESLLCNGINDCPDATDELAPQCSRENEALGVDTSTTNPLALIVPIISGCLLLCAIVGIYLCLRRSSEKANTSLPSDHHLPPSAPIHNPTIMDPSNHHFISSETLHRDGRHTPVGMGPVKLVAPPPPDVGVPRSHVGGSSNGLLYDRSHVTGASSSTTSSAGFPNECYGPPPSPTTTVPRCSSVVPRCSSLVGSQGLQHKSSNSLSRRPRGPESAYRYYHHHRRKPQYPPPPTPCSTDCNDESDASAALYASFQPPQRPHYCSAANSMVGYDSEVYEPQMESYYPPHGEAMFEPDEAGPCPDSPSQERAYFLNSLPEPPPPSRMPSPTPEDDSMVGEHLS